MSHESELAEVLARLDVGQCVVVNVRKANSALVEALTAADRFTYIGRATRGYRGATAYAESKWSNPYRVGLDGDRDAVIRLYRAHLASRSDLMDALPELSGRALGCWCSPQACHGDVLAAAATASDIVAWSLVDNLSIALAAPPDATAKGKQFGTREEWLAAAVGILRVHLFASMAYVVPELRVACGWPTKGYRAIGACYARSASTDGLHQIFISPTVGDPVKVLSTLVHELAHAVDDCSGHGPTFKRIALAVGLTGRMTATSPGDELAKSLGMLAEMLGEYPHSAIRTLPRSTTPTGRMLKMWCNRCGCTLRTTAKWIDEYGSEWPCPCGQTLRLEVQR